MNKHEYLNTQIVKEFIAWLSPKLDENFIHQYNINNRGRINQNWIRYNHGNNWKCDSIYHAFLQYYWEGVNLTTTTNLLSSFGESLIEALNTNNASNADQACYNILKWGGQRVFTPNYNWIKKIDNITSYLNETRNSLNPLQFNDDISFVQNNGVKRFNAGLTKIYSLCIEDFAIYDSRVGIAFTLLISQFLIENGISKIPFELHLKIPPGSNNENRPNIINGFRFGYTNNNKIHYQISNVRASWIFEQILKNNTNSKFNSLPSNQRMRGLEAAFFMIGYSI